MVSPPVYLRVGPSGSGHTRFIHDMCNECNQDLLSRHNMTPKKFINGMPRCRGSKKRTMVAFDDIRPKDMCKASRVVYLFHPSSPCKTVDTWVFSVREDGMNSCGEVDADDVMRYVFPGGDFEAHRDMLYRNITEVHHMLADGTVRVLACGGKKLEDAVVLSYHECIERTESLYYTREAVQP